MADKKLIPIEKITVDDALQIRVKVHEQTIKDYRTIIRDQGNMDPIAVFRQGDGPFLLADGFQRLQAYREEKRTEIPAEIHQGNRHDALRHAIRQNCHHGVRVSNADKRHACEMAVMDAALAALPDKEIAWLIGVSPTLIGDVRRGETPRAKKERRKSLADKKGKRGSGGAALIPVVAHERRAPGDKKPTKAMCLKQIEEWMNEDIISEEEIVDSFATGSGRWVWEKKKAASR